MNRGEVRKLLGGYAAGTLTEEEMEEEHPLELERLKHLTSQAEASGDEEVIIEATGEKK